LKCSGVCPVQYDGRNDLGVADACVVGKTHGLQVNDGVLVAAPTALMAVQYSGNRAENTVAVLMARRRCDQNWNGILASGAIDILLQVGSEGCGGSVA